jgi:hypothetical protein
MLGAWMGVDLRVGPFAIDEQCEKRFSKGRNLVRRNEQPNSLREAELSVV